MSSIRLLRDYELPLLLPGAREFFATGDLLGELNESHLVASLQGQIRAGVGFVLVAEGAGGVRGSIAGALFPDFATGDLVCMEFYWFVPPTERGVVGPRLLRAFEAEAMRRGAKRIMMMHLVKAGDEKFNRFYERCGYRLVEQVYAKTTKEV